MRVYYNDQTYIDFPNATHWEQCNGDWVVLTNDDDEIQAVLNWRQVWLMRPLGNDAAKLKRF